MWSLQYLYKKLGLAKHILTQTSELLEDLKHNMYFPIDITHIGHSATNTLRRISCSSHFTSQVSEEALTDKRIADEMAGRWGSSDDVLDVEHDLTQGRGENWLARGGGGGSWQPPEGGGGGLAMGHL